MTIEVRTKEENVAAMIDAVPWLFLALVALVSLVSFLSFEEISAVSSLTYTGGISVLSVAILRVLPIRFWPFKSMILSFSSSHGRIIETLTGGAMAVTLCIWLFLFIQILV